MTDVVKDMLKDMDLKQFIKSDLENFCENEEISKVIILALNKVYKDDKKTIKKRINSPIKSCDKER